MKTYHIAVTIKSNLDIADLATQIRDILITEYSHTFTHGISIDHISTADPHFDDDADKDT